MINNKTMEKILLILEKEYNKFEEPIISKLIKIERDPYRVLIGTIISLRTKDNVTKIASEKLFAKADTPKKMIKLKEKKIEKLIYPAGFYKTKAKNIIKVSEILLDKYSGVVPDTIDELLTLPGVGRKTANLVIALGYGKNAICVDTHVHRISNRLGYVRTKNPEETEFALREKLPVKWWIKYNDLLVVWGQNVCKPISPFCSKCKIEKYCEKKNVDKFR